MIGILPTAPDQVKTTRLSRAGSCRIVKASIYYVVDNGRSMVCVIYSN